MERGPGFLSVTQVAELLGVERHTIQTWVDEGRFPGSIRTAGGHRRIPLEAVEQIRRHNGKGKALLYVRVADERERGFLDLGVAHLRYATEKRGYTVARIVQEIGPGTDGRRQSLESLRAEIRSGEPGYEVIVVERADRLLLLGGDEFGRWVGPAVRVDVAGASCPEADAVYRRELLLDLFYPLADALAWRGVPPARIERVISQGLEGMAEALGLLGGKPVLGRKAMKR